MSDANSVDLRGGEAEVLEPWMEESVARLKRAYGLLPQDASETVRLGGVAMQIPAQLNWEGIYITELCRYSIPVIAGRTITLPQKIERLVFHIPQSFLNSSEKPVGLRDWKRGGVRSHLLYRLLSEESYKDHPFVPYAPYVLPEVSVIAGHKSLTVGAMQDLLLRRGLRGLNMNEGFDMLALRQYLLFFGSVCPSKILFMGARHDQLNIPVLSYMECAQEFA